MPSPEPAPGEVPPASSTWATDPLSEPLTGEPASGVDTPADLAASVAAAQPGTWPTGPDDLLDGLPTPGGAGTGPEEFEPSSADETEWYPPRPEPGHGLGNPGPKPEPATGPGDLFTVTMKIVPVEDSTALRFELTAVGTAPDVYQMIEKTARAFVEWNLDI